jgi:hypothetical protein
MEPGLQRAARKLDYLGSIPTRPAKNYFLSLIGDRQLHGNGFMLFHFHVAGDHQLQGNGIA